jgi:membrane protease YdiL (CAAX protease family)
LSEARSRRNRARGSGWLLIGRPLLGVAALIGVEAGLFARGHILAGDIADAVLVIALLNVGRDANTSALSARADPGVAAVRALAFVALIRVVALGLPLRDGSNAFGTLVVAILVGVPAILAAPYLGVSLWAMATRLPPVRRPTAVAGLVVVAAAGLALGLVAYLVGAPALWRAGAPRNTVLVALVAACAAAAVEEVLFRGLVQVTLQRVAGRAGVLAASALFAAMYLSVRPAALVLTIALAGLLFAITVAWSGRLQGALLGHVFFVVGAGGLWPSVIGRSHPTWLSEPGTTIGLSVALAVLAAIVLLRPVASAPAPPAKPSASAYWRDDEVVVALTPNRSRDR